jgi:hypothetical protein
MTKNIALLIGVADYVNEQKLPACESDVVLMAEIIAKSGKYSEKLVLQNSPKSIEGKEKIAQFIRVHQEQEIEELFFYYSGHGARHSDDFLYLFSDFSRNRLEQTSLRNTELDTMLRSLNPKLAVKVVDACQAGMEYIKSDQDLKTIFEKATSSKNFEKIYFLFSSSRSENSVALPDYSVFTRSIAQAVANFNNSEVRFRDIMDFVSDDELVKKYQTPLFIQQANNTEVFCLVTDELKSCITARLTQPANNLDMPEKSGDEQLESISFETKLINEIRKKSQDYCDEEEGMESLNIFIDAIEAHPWKEPILTLYSLSHARQSDNDTIGDMASIGEWLNKASEDYFAKVIYTSQEYEVQERIEYDDKHPNLMFETLRGIVRANEYRTVKRTKDVINGIQQTVNTPCSAIIISLKPKEQALPWFKIFVPFIFSKSTLTAFLRCEKEKELSWEKRVTQSTGEWQTLHCKLKDRSGVSELASALLESATKIVVQDIAASVDLSHPTEPVSFVE